MTSLATFREPGHEGTCFPFHCPFPQQLTFLQTLHTRKNDRGTVGRLLFVHPTAGERYYLRLLLCNVSRSTSYEDLRTVDGVVNSTFRGAAAARGLLLDDSEWIALFNESVTFMLPPALQRLFATVLLNCEPSDGKELSLKYCDAFSDDFLHANRLNLDNDRLLLFPPLRSRSG